MPMPPRVPLAPPPPAPLLRMRCRKRRRNAQRKVTYATSGAEKRRASGEYPLSSAPCTQGRVSTLRWLAWLKTRAWPASPLNHGVTTKTPPTPCVLHCHLLRLGLHLLISSPRSSSSSPPPRYLLLPLFLLLLLLLPPVLVLLLLLLPPLPLLLRQVRRLLTRGVAGRWGGGVSGGWSPRGVGLRGRRSLRWRWGWSLSLNLSLS